MPINAPTWDETEPIAPPTWDETEAMDTTPTRDETTPIESSISDSGPVSVTQIRVPPKAGISVRPPNFLDTAAATLGAANQAAGEKIKKEAEAAAFSTVGDVEDALREKGFSERSLERMGLRSEKLEQGTDPFEQGVQSLPLPARLISRGTTGLIESAPQMAEVAGGEALGIPAPISAAAMFGATPQGFDVKQAAIGALLPEVGKYSGALTESVASRLGVSTPAALSIINRAGGAGGVATLLSADQIHTISQLPPDKRGDAFVSAAANALSMSWLGMMGEHPAPDRPARVAAVQLSRAAREVPAPENLREFGQPLPPPLTETGTPPASRPGIPRRPPETPRPKRNQPVEVPGTPAEPYETAVETVRKAGADTIAKIQKLFPKANLNRERARELRDAAFPPSTLNPQPSTENASQITPSTEIHGNVRPQSGQSEGQVPVQESDAGIQPPAETPEGEVPLKAGEEPRPYEKAKSEQLQYNAKKADATISVAKTPAGWIAAVDYAHHTGTHQRMGTPLNESGRIYPTREAAIHDSAAELIVEQQRLLQRNDASATQKAEAKNMIQWATQYLSPGTGTPKTEFEPTPPAPETESPATTGPTTGESPSREEIGSRPGVGETENLGGLSQQLLQTGLDAGLSRGQTVALVKRLAKERGLRDWPDTRNAEDYHKLIAALREHLEEGRKPAAHSSGLELARQIAAHPLDQPFKSGFTEEALRAGASLDPAHPEQLEELRHLETQAKAELDAIPKDMAHIQQIQTVGLKKQWLTEAIQAATGVEQRDVAKKILGPDYQPPFPGGKPRQKGVANVSQGGQISGGDIGTTEPTPTKSGGVAPSETLQSPAKPGTHAPADIGSVGDAPSPGTRPAVEAVERERKSAGKSSGVADVQTSDAGTSKSSDAGTGPVSGSGNIGQTEAGIMPETPKEAAEKVADAITEAPRKAKDIKADLVDRLEKAIAAAPAEADLTTKQQGALNDARRFKPSASGFTDIAFDKQIKDAMKKVSAAGIKQITIAIPGDGTFTVWNTKEALSQVLERAKRIQTTPGTSPKVKRTKLGEEINPEDWLNSSEPTHEVSIAIIEKGKKVREESVKGKPVVIPGHEDKSLFLTSSGKIFNITEPRTGLSVTSGRTIKEAIANAKARLDNSDFQRAVETSIAQHGEGKGVQPISSQPATGQVQAFGGGVRGMPPPSTPPTPPVATTPQQLTALQNNFTPGLTGGAQSLLSSAASKLSNPVQGLQALVLPSSLSPAHLTEAERLSSFLGPMHRAAEVSNTALKAASKYFDKRGVHREDLPPAQNPGLQFMSAMSTGAPLPSPLQNFATQIQRLFYERLRKLEAADAPLETIRQNYFPGMWTRQSREAFNAALQMAFDQGVIPRNADLNTATAQQKAWVKAKVDQMIDAGQGSDADMLGYLTRRPLAGGESFRKPKVFDDIMTGAEFGLHPVSYNPIDVVKLKLAEMDRSIMAHREFQSLKVAGKLRIINPYGEVPEGWQKVNDKYGTIYGAPTVTIPEYVDKEMYNDLVDFARSIGVRHTRSMTFPPGPGQSALGLSYTGRSAIRTRFATPMNVLAHEIGHQLDEKYGLWDYMTHGEKGNERSVWQKELRAIADLTGRNKQYTRQRDEKIAQMVEGYIYAKDRMVAVAPNIFTKFDSFIRGTQALKKFADIKPGLKHEKLTGEKYVGLPIMGYRIVPQETADILNNYLSSSLYNNRYFGSLYRGWIGAANALNQTQLGVGSMFHAGFTTTEAQVSAGANVIKDVYGVARGNRSLSDLLNTAKVWSTAAVNTFSTGDKVLDAWRNPQGTIDPKIANVVRAAELAGGGFKLERGMTTEQATKMVRDWYSGKKLKAAMRSPVALTELLAKPVMEWIVPRQKAGVFAALANRIIEQNPGVPLEELTPQFRQAWNRTDARLGQVRYDRLFANNTAKNVIQGLVRAPGWTGGTIAEIGGAFPDTAKFLREWITNGRAPENIPDRTAYLLSLLVTVGTINGVLTYAFTGQMPHGMDYMAFRDGTKDKYGNENRFLLPSYMKDILAYATKVQSHGVPGGTWDLITAKSHPALSVISDVVNNRDYYGYEVYDSHASWPTQQAQKLGYVLKSFEPFWTRGVRKAHQQGSGLAQQAASFVGIMPAPGYITMSPMQREIADLYHKRSGEPTRPYGTENAPKKHHDPRTLDIYQFKHLPESDRKALAAKMTPEEKRRYGGP